MKKPDHLCRATCEGREKCIFLDVDSSTRDEIEQNAIFDTYKKNAIIFLQGGTPNGIYCVHSGKIKIVMVNNEGKESISRIANPGSIIGHRALFSGEVFHASAIALEDAVVVFFHKDYILNLLKLHPVVALKLLSQLSESVGTSDLFSANLVHKNVRERLAGQLLKLKEDYGVKENNHYRLNIKLTREEMAAMIGTTHETLVRLITELKNEEIIIQEGKIIIIINEKKLIEFAND